jgi:EAL domain-containing protein (putative c-di-GMP-specific phosphodiesterase class I)
MRAPVAMGERELHTSVSIGITNVPRDADPDECLAQADAAMYQAKRSGPAHFEVYNPSIGDVHRREGMVADELRVAHRRGELSLHYQPLFRLADGSPAGLVGMEALLRWAHPELGNVPPSEFVPLLERSRQIVSVGRWVLEEAAFQCCEWQAKGSPDMTMSVNVSARQLQDPGFYDDVRDALDGSGLDPDRLVLEVTESVLVVDIAQIGATMQRVRDLGVHLALDDFGTGYSSLLYLQGMPIDRLKIDRSFVSALNVAGHDKTIIQTVVDLAHTLGITVVAEGVETQAELRAIGGMGCDEVQGFLLGRPAPAHLVSLAEVTREQILAS